MTLTKINLTLYKEQLRKIIRDHASKCPGKKVRPGHFEVSGTFRGRPQIFNPRNPVKKIFPKKGLKKKKFYWISGVEDMILM